MSDMQPTAPTTRVVGEGDVPVVITGEELTLKPSYNATRVISTTHGGIQSAMDKVLRLDVETITQVITLGLGFTSTNRGPKDLPQRIYRTGFTDDTGRLAETCIKYLRVLASGGKAPSPTEEGGDGSEEEEGEPRKDPP